jgi:hypothetical protein
MALSLTNADAALKEFYLPAIRKQLNDTNKFLNQIDKNSKDVEGRRAILSLHVGRNSGVGARAENGTLPTAGSQQYAEERVGLHYNYGRIQLSGPVIKTMKSDKGSFTRAVQSETTGLVNDVKRDYNRQLWGTSNGVIATCGTTTTSATIVLATTTTVVQMRQLEVGMVIDIGTVASPTTIASARTITAVDFTNKTIDISGATVSTTGSHFIFRSGSGGTGVEITGLQTIVDDTGTLFNVNPTTYPVWKSTVLGNSGTNRPVSENLFERALMETEIVAGEEPDQIWVSDGVFRAAGDMLTAMKRFVNTTKMRGGFDAVSMQVGGRELSFTWERDVPSNKAFVLNTKHLTQHELSDWDWMDDDGAVLNRVANTDAYEATLFKYSELTTDKRNAHTLIEDITES